MAKKNCERQSNPAGENDLQKQTVPKSQTIQVVRETLISELKLKGEGTIELVHRKWTFEKNAGHLIGIAVNGLAKAGHIVRVDLRHSQRVQAHGRFVSVWRLK